MTFFDFIEIGTADFDTLSQSWDRVSAGMSIEPVPYYLDALPKRKEVRKLNMAVSDTDGMVAVYYLPPDLISKYNLPGWLRGCNSVESPHPLVVHELNKIGLTNSFVNNYLIPRKTLLTICENENVSGIFLLKIDTEGHEFPILNHFFSNADLSLFPYELIFETNIRSNPNQVAQLIAKLITEGYDIVSASTGKWGSDTHLRLNNLRRRRSGSLRGPIQGFYLNDYPEKYNLESPGHDNSLSGALNFAASKNLGGVTFENGRYEARCGEYLLRAPEGTTATSWIFT